MTSRNEQRAKCIEAMAVADCELSGELWNELSEAAREDYRMNARPLFDSLHGLARVNPIEATKEMVDPKVESEGQRRTWRYMSAAGDITNPPGEKP